MASAQGERREQARGLGLIVLSTLAYGTLPILGKLAYAAGVRPALLLAWRFSIAAALFAAPPRRPRLPWRVRASLWGLGAVFLVNALAYFHALERVPASTVALLIYTYPVIVTLLAGLLGLDPLTPRGLLAAVLAFAGCALTASGAMADAAAAPEVGAGVVLVLVAAFVYASYIVLGSRLAAGVPTRAAVLHLSQVGALGCVAWAASQGSLWLPDDPRAWGSVLAIAVLSTVVALYAFLAGLARVGPARAAVLSSLEVVVTLVLAAGLLGERLGLRQAAGAALILGAVVFQNLATLRRLARGARAGDGAGAAL